MNAKKFANHCGFLVRGKFLINACKWKTNKDGPRISFVSDIDKMLLWNEITAPFELPVDDDLKGLVKSWALKKMATQFQT